MADRTTFFKIDRKLLYDSIWLAEPFTRGQAWVDLIGRCNFADKTHLYKGVLQEVKRGQIPTSTIELATRWKWSRGKVARFLDALETNGMIKQKRTTNGTLITVENYGFYQDSRTTNDTTNGQQTEQRTDNGRTRNKKEKKEKNNKEFSSPSREEVRGYVSSMGFSFNADEFCDTYEETGWKDAKGQPIRNWRALCRKWNSTQPVTYKKEPTAMEKIMAEIKTRKEAEQ